MVDIVTVVVERSVVGAHSIAVRHLAVEVDHHDEAHRLEGQGCAHVVVGTFSLSFLEQVGNVAGSTQEEVLVNGRGDTLCRVPVGLETDGCGTGSRRHHLGDGAGTGVGRAPSIHIIILDPRQAVVDRRTLVARTVRIGVDIEPLRARRQAQKQDQTKHDGKYLFHNRIHINLLSAC